MFCGVVEMPPQTSVSISDGLRLRPVTIALLAREMDCMHVRDQVWKIPTKSLCRGIFDLLRFRDFKFQPVACLVEEAIDFCL